MVLVQNKTYPEGLHVNSSVTANFELFFFQNQLNHMMKIITCSRPCSSVLWVIFTKKRISLELTLLVKNVFSRNFKNVLKNYLLLNKSYSHCSYESSTEAISTISYCRILYYYGLGAITNNEQLIHLFSGSIFKENFFCLFKLIENSPVVCFFTLKLEFVSNIL